MSTVFPTASLGREAAWETHLADLTPVELRGQRWYKRDDLFAPLGVGGINGSKLRQLIWLIDRARPTEGVLTACSVLSPQASMTALVARHFELPSVICLGATHYQAAVKHPNVALAAVAGAEFIFAPVAYNPALQRSCDEIAGRAEFAGWYRLPYAISTPVFAEPEEVEAFHRVGAAQVANIPAAVETLTMTAGSCNSCASVLYGIALHRPAGLARVVLFGVGPTRLAWLEQRLVNIERASGVKIRGLFRRAYHHHRDLEERHQTDGEILLEHWDLHSTGFATYQDRRPWTSDGVVLHPTYEGKMLAYLHRHRSGHAWWHGADGDVCFWIVGGTSKLDAMPALR
jgi:1-aminocyclopropane-1-carboxylate deaminase/D-cysteine desulfhydrase-like pyridoxal-dependent ACC family enzyme